MSKEASVTINEKTGEIEIDLEGYEGDVCNEELARMIKLFRAEGYDLDTGKIEKKLPRIPLSHRQKEKVKG